MTNLIFPYIELDNSLVERTKDCALISLNKKGIILNGLYSKIYNIPEKICEKITKLERFYLEKSYYDKNFDFYSFIQNKKETFEMPEQIVRELKFNSFIKETDTSVEEKIVFSGFFLKLFEKYESEKKAIDSSFLEIQKREKELFHSLTNEKNESNLKKEENFDNLPRDLIKKRIFSWFELYFYLGMPCSRLITDKKEYIDILLENGFIVNGETSDLNQFYLSDFEFLLNKSKVLQEKGPFLKNNDKKIGIKVLNE